MKQLIVPAVGTLFAVVLATGTASAQQVTCMDFSTQAAAQEAYRADPTSLSILDRDRDGIACEDNPVPYDLYPVI